MKNPYFFFILISVLLQNPLSAQLSPQVAVAEMGRGINLGNTLEPPTEGAWNNGPAQESFFDTYINAGFTNVRIPVRWDQHTANTAPFSVDTSWMNRVEEVVDWGLSRGLYITLNGHHEDWLKNNYSNATLRARYDSIWVQIAERFQNKSDKLLFEIINEPNGMTVAQVDDLNQRILGIIRASNPTRIVIYGGNMYANSDQLLNAAIPNDNYIIGYYHAYDPWQFSGQGMGTWGTANDYQQLTNKYQSVKNWSITNNIPIHHSEFGAVLACDFNSRMRIYAHNIEQCTVNGFAFSVWDDGGDFGVLNRGNNSWPEVKDILMHYHQDSPNQIFSTFTPDPTTNAPTIVVDWNNRATASGDIILERSVGSNAFVQIASLPANTTTFTDVNVEEGKTYTYRMYTTRADGTLLHGYPTRLRITASVQTPFNQTSIAIPGVLEVEEYDNGGEGLAYHDNEAANIPGGFRVDEGVDIGALGNDYILEYVASGEWIEYTVEVAQAGIYSVTAEIASEVANGTFSITFDKNNASSNFTVPSTGAWYTFQSIAANNTIDLEAGEQVMRLDITNNNAFNVDDLTFTLEAANSIDELDARQAGFSVFPNPTKDILHIEISDALQDRHTQLTLFTASGEKVGTFDLNGTSTTLDLADLASGLYLLQFVNDEVSLTHRIVIR
ncbi:MAG: cellulase family glycosylhydrolase [Bacteroidia bacterium]